MLVTRRLSFSEYVSFVSHFEDASLYHGESWQNVVSDGFNTNIFGLLTTSPGGYEVALTPVMGIRKGFLSLVGSPLRGMYTEYAGPLFARGIDKEEKHQTVISQHAQLKRMGASYIEWGARGGEDTEVYEHMHALCNHGYMHAPWSTYLVDLGQGLDRVWKGFESRARNMVRKAEKNGVVVRTISPTENDVTNYYNMLRQTFRRQGRRPPHPFPFFQAIRSHLAPAGLLRFMVAEKGSRLVAGALFLCHGRRMVYLSGSSTEEGGRLAANSLIQWIAMRQAADNGIVEYDLGGAGVHAAIDKFKASFGGKPSVHHRWVYRSWPIQLMEPIYRRLADKGWARLHD